MKKELINSQVVGKIAVLGLIFFGSFLASMTAEASCGYIGDIPPVPSPNYPPTCELYASDMNVSSGERVTLSWAADPEDATTVWFNQGICEVDGVGSMSVYPTETTTYILNVYNDVPGRYGLATCSKTITVTDPEPEPDPPVCDAFNITPSSITGPGYVTFSWDTTNADSVRINHGIGYVEEDGSMSVWVSRSGIYTLTAINDYGTDTCTQDVIVYDIPDPDPEPPVCDAFNITPSSRVGPGFVTFSWNTTNADEVYISGGVGSVAADGTKSVWVSQSGTYTLTASNDDGTDTCTDSVTIYNIPDPDPEPPVCDAFSVSPSSITSPGYVTLSWGTTDADSVFIDNGVGFVSDDGSKNVYVSGDTTWTLTVTNSDGTDSCTTSVDFDPVYEPPICEIEAADVWITQGESTTLFWETTHQGIIELSPGFGIVPSEGSVQISPNVTTTYVLSISPFFGDGPTFLCEETVYVEPPKTEPPVCDAFNITPSSRVGSGYVTFSWNTTNADSVSINNGVGPVAQDGSIPVWVSQSGIYTLTASNSEGSVTCTDSVEVLQVERDLPRCDSFIISDSRVDEGDYVTISWNTSFADEVVINNGIGDVSVDGSRTFRVYDSQTWTLTAINDYGIDTCQVHVDVEEEGVSCDWFYVSDDYVDEGDYVTLEWETTNADDVYINNGIGDVSDDGSERIRVYDDTTFTLTARNGSDTDTCTVRVEVDEDDDDDDVQCDSFTVSDSRVDEGDRVTLRWRTTNADDVYINNGVGDVDDDGSERVRVYDDTTFTLTARGDGDRDTCRVTVRVDDDDDEVQCDSFTVSDDEVDEGDYVTLRWRTSNADDVDINNGVGDVDDDGSERVRVYEDTTWTLTARGDGDRDTCRVSVDVDDGEVAGISFFGNRYQDGIVLSSTPYTGFEAGKALTFLFYLAIGIWAAVIAYALVIKKRNSLQFVAATPALNTYNTVAPEVANETISPQFDVEENEIPNNIPTGNVFEAAEDSIKTLESHAHSNYTLISSDGLRYIENQSPSREGQINMLDSIIEKAKARYPKEGDWTVLNKERIISLMT